MYLKKLFFTFLFSIPFSFFAQQNFKISGKITIDNLSLSDAVIVLKINDVQKYAVSNKDGMYVFSNINKSNNDSIFLSLKHIGYKEFIKKIINLNENRELDIALIAVDPEVLKEVVVSKAPKILQNAKKSVFKINQNDFVRNANFTEVLNSIPNVYLNIENGKIVVDGNLTAKIFIDGVEVNIKECEQLKALEIQRIEILNNPSGTFGTDFFGAVLNIITIKKTVEFIKGNVGFTGGLSNNYKGFTPSFSYKKGNFLIKSFLELKQYTQTVDYSINRNENNNTYIQKSSDLSKSKQTFNLLRVNLQLSKKASLNLSGLQSGYKFDGQAFGFLSDNYLPLPFSKSGSNSNIECNVAGVYNYKINENKNLFVKSTYSVFEIEQFTILNFNKTKDNSYLVNSKSKEFSTDLDYEIENFMILKKNVSAYFDLKYIDRNYSFSNSNFSINQSVFDFTSELDTEWSDEFSTETTVSFEHVVDKNNRLYREYNLFLPSINALYHFKNKTDAKFSFSRRVLRPNANDLNDEITVLNPGIAKQGNSELNPQIRNYIALSISKLFNKDFFNLKFYNESINNSIEEVYKNSGVLLIQTLENAAKYNVIGMSFGINKKLWKNFSLNMNTGICLNSFEDNSMNALIKKSEGFSFIGNFFLSTRFFKDKLSLSCSGRLNNPDFSLLSKRVSSPYLDLSLKSNFFKDKLTVSVYAQNLLGYNASGFTDISNFNNFFQKIEARNSSSNLLISLTYNFGKNFNDQIDDNNINNEDVRK